MAQYSLEIWNKGYTEDLFYYDFIGCLNNALEKFTGLPGDDPQLEEGSYTTEDGIRYTWMHLTSFESDSDVWCKGCGDFMQHGLECECADRTTERDPLTEDQMKML